MSFFVDDFESKIVEPDEVQQHLEYAIATDYLQSRSTNPQSADNAALAIWDDT